jgi:tetratricopeptide (TPR) repeat protein
MPERQHTLRATIEWSYQLLHADARRTFDALGVFPGTFAADAAERIAAADIDQLGELMDKSLLQRAANGRFFMLATIREEARSRLDAGREGKRVRAAHASHYLAFVEQHRARLDAQDAELLDRVELEHDNVRAALTWFTATGESERELALAAALGRFWHVHGHLVEGRQRLEHALAAGTNPPLRAVALRLLAIIAETQGDHDAAAAAAAESITLYDEVGDSAALAKALHTRGSIAIAQGDLVAARADYASAEALFRRAGDTPGVAVTASTLAYIALLEDDPRALELAERAVTAVRTQGLPEAIPLLTLAFAYVRQSNPDAAVSAAREAAEIAAELGHKEALSYCVEAIGAAAALRGDGETATRLLAAAEAARSVLSVTLDPFESRINEEARAAASESISGERFAAAWAEGAALTLEQAIEIALGRPLTVPPA